MDIPQGAEREYIAVYGIAAIYVARRPDGRAIVRCARDLALADRALRRRWPGAYIGHVYWAPSHQEARRILRDVVEDRGSLTIIDRACKNIIKTADRLGIPLHDHTDVVVRAEEVVKFIDEKIALANRNGGMKWFNCAYKEWRVQAEAHGVSRSKTMFKVALSYLRKRMYRNIIDGLDVNDADPRKIFPQFRH